MRSALLLNVKFSNRTGQNIQSATAATIVAGQASGEVVVVQADWISRQVVKTGRDVVDKARSSGEIGLNVSRNVGEGVVAGATVAGWITEDAGQSVSKSVAAATSQAATTTQKMATAIPYKKPIPLVDQAESDIIEIATISNQTERLNRITAGCHRQRDVLLAFELYFMAGLNFPFRGTWRDPDQPGHIETVTVLGLDSIDGR